MRFFRKSEDFNRRYEFFVAADPGKIDQTTSLLTGNGTGSLGSFTDWATVKLTIEPHTTVIYAR